MNLAAIIDDRTNNPGDRPGLWWVSGYPELTTTQLVWVAFNPPQSLADPLSDPKIPASETPAKPL